MDLARAAARSRSSPTTISAWSRPIRWSRPLPEAIPSPRGRDARARHHDLRSFRHRRHRDDADPRCTRTANAGRHRRRRANRLLTPETTVAFRWQGPRSAVLLVMVPRSNPSSPWLLLCSRSAHSRPPRRSACATRGTRTAARFSSPTSSTRQSTSPATPRSSTASVTRFDDQWAAATMFHFPAADPNRTFLL